MNRLMLPVAATPLLIAFVAISVALAGSTQNPPRLCDAFGESSEENCNQNSNAPDPYRADPKDFKVHYLLYKNPESPEDYTELYIDDPSIVKHVDPTVTWKFLVHGFTNKNTSQFPVNVKLAYLEHLKLNTAEPFNLVVFDWGEGAKINFRGSFETFKFLYQHAVENVQPAGEKLGDMISFLYKKNLIRLKDGDLKVHLIGHSLGSHVSGHAARQVFKNTGKMIARTSALDPAGPLFSRKNLFGNLNPLNRKPYPRLHRSRVGFLDVYHTSKEFGMIEEIGDIDFYINGGKDQPSCAKFLRVYIEEQGCSHQYAPEFFAKSINNKTMRACTGCTDYKEYHRGKCECDDNPVIGEYVTEDTNDFDGYPMASGMAFYDNTDFKPDYERAFDWP